MIRRYTPFLNGFFSLFYYFTRFTPYGSGTRAQRLIGSKKLEPLNSGLGLEDTTSMCQGVRVDGQRAKVKNDKEPEPNAFSRHACIF